MFSPKAEIDIMFASREHGDGIRNAFGQDMLGNVVAHAFFPSHRDYDVNHIRSIYFKTIISKTSKYWQFALGGCAFR